MSREFERQVGAKLHPLVDDRFEAVTKKFGLPKAEMLRRCIDIALPKLERARHLPAIVREEGGTSK